MSAELVDPFAPATHEPMTLKEYDAIRDDGQEAVLTDRAYLPDAYQFLLRSLGTLAQTSHDPDGYAARVLRELRMRAKDGIPMNERGQQI